MKKNLMYLPVFLLLSGCVANKVLRQSQLETANLRGDSTQLANSIIKLQDEMASLNNKMNSLNNKNLQLGEQSATQQSQL